MLKYLPLVVEITCHGHVHRDGESTGSQGQGWKAQGERREVGSAALCHSAMWISQELFIYFSSLDNFQVILQNTNETFV